MPCQNGKNDMPLKPNAGYNAIKHAEFLD